MPMNQDLKAKWLEALRSGRYKQGTNMLRDKEGGFCCLGVLCDVSGLGEWVLPEPGEPAWAYDHKGVRAAAAPPYSMDEALGLGGPNCLVLVKGQKRSLPELNDSGMSFAEISDLIEEQL